MCSKGKNNPTLFRHDVISISSFRFLGHECRVRIKGVMKPHRAYTFFFFVTFLADDAASTLQELRKHTRVYLTLEKGISGGKLGKHFNDSSEKRKITQSGTRQHTSASNTQRVNSHHSLQHTFFV